MHILDARGARLCEAQTHDAPRAPRADRASKASRPPRRFVACIWQLPPTCLETPMRCASDRKKTSATRPLKRAPLFPSLQLRAPAHTVSQHGPLVRLSQLARHRAPRAEHHSNAPCDVSSSFRPLCASLSLTPLAPTPRLAGNPCNHHPDPIFSSLACPVHSEQSSSLCANQ